MTGLGNLIKRNSTLFFKDKGMFFSSLVTPLILLVLYATFLANVYRDSFMAGLPQGFAIDEALINGIVAGQLISSLLSVSCITVAFCSNMIMVQDKVSGAGFDLGVTPVKKSVLSLSYYISTLITTLAICYLAMGAGLVYVAVQGWYMSVGDVLLLVLDVLILSTFGTALSSLINVFLTSQGQITAIQTIVSAGYGFICGAYMPISSFSSGLQTALCFFPWTYGTSLVKNHSLNGAFNEMINIGVPSGVVDGIKSSLDCSIKFFDTDVSQLAMYLVMVGSVILLMGIFVAISILKGRKKSKR